MGDVGQRLGRPWTLELHRGEKMRLVGTRDDDRGYAQRDQGAHELHAVDPERPRRKVGEPHRPICNRATANQ
jgi:hypothetical protein